MNVKNRTWLNNAFWETPQKKILNAICEFEDEQGRVIRQVMKMSKFETDNVTVNSDFDDCVKQLGEDAIQASTDERRTRKLSELDLEKARKLEEQRARKMEQLFEYKLELFEVPEIKNTKLRKYRAKLRRAKSIPEANLYSMIIMKSELGIEDGEI
jgi:hypothetical protein